MIARAAESRMESILLALADPTRRAILQQLAAGEARVTDLARPFTVSLNAVSKHIRVLEHARLIRRRRSGREHILSLDPQPLDAVAAWIETQRASWASRRNVLDALLQAEDQEFGPGTSTEKESTP